MPLDVNDLVAFYASPLGDVTRRLIGRVLRARWEDCRGLSILGLGFAGPLLDRFRDQAQRTLAFMPAEVGVARWPAQGRAAAALVELDMLPLPDASIDRALVVHGLETAEYPAACWRKSGACWRRAAARCSSCRRGAAFGRGSTAIRSARASRIRGRNCATLCARRCSRRSPGAKRFMRTPFRRRFFLNSAAGDRADRRGDGSAFRRRSDRRGDQAALPPGRRASGWRGARRWRCRPALRRSPIASRRGGVERRRWRPRLLRLSRGRIVL